MRVIQTPVSLHLVTILAGAALVVGCAAPKARDTATAATADAGPSSLGSFSISLAVQDIAASQAFYETLGFKDSGHGDPAMGWMVLRNGQHVIGLFQGMFENNIMTFNPGWNQGAEPVGDFVDVRDLQRRLEAAGLTLTTRADPDSTGPASFTLNDPDGNMILIDQHVPAPK